MLEESRFGQEATEKTSSDHLSDEQLVEGYQKQEVEGSAVMGRLLAKLDLSQMASESLRDASGEIITHENKPLAVADYLTIAKEHGPAIQIILNFIRMDEGDPRYPAAKEAISSIISGYMPANTDKSN